MQLRTRNTIEACVVFVFLTAVVISVVWICFYFWWDKGDREQREWCKDAGGIVVDTDGDNVCIDDSSVIEKPED